MEWLRLVLMLRYDYMISQNILVCYLAVTAVNIKCEHKQVTICENQPIDAEHHHVSGDSLQVQF